MSVPAAAQVRGKNLPPVPSQISIAQQKYVEDKKRADAHIYGRGHAGGTANNKRYSLNAPGVMSAQTPSSSKHSPQRNKLAGKAMIAGNMQAQ